jgi:hypothetical protein
MPLRRKPLEELPRDVVPFNLKPRLSPKPMDELPTRATALGQLVKIAQVFTEQVLHDVLNGHGLSLTASAQDLSRFKQVRQHLSGTLGISPLGDQGKPLASHRPKCEHSHNRFGIHPSAAYGEVDLRLKLAGHRDDDSRRS